MTTARATRKIATAHENRRKERAIGADIGDINDGVLGKEGYAPMIFSLS
jgi:hypothetical protein